VTDAVSERATIRFDMAGTCDVQFAAEFCREISPELVQCVIDPLGPNDLAGLVPLSRQTNVPLAIAATVQSPSDVLRLASSGAAPWVVLDLQQLGGIWPTRLASAVAEAGQLTPLLRIPPSLGVGMAAMLQTVACTPAVALANESDFYQLQDDLLSEPIEMANGLAAVPQGPGLGIEVDRGKLERYLVN
jgi:L-alanine-DL-glutamate epimerase-like enolase superfamily enzyme